MVWAAAGAQMPARHQSDFQPGVPPEAPRVRVKSWMETWIKPQTQKHLEKQPPMGFGAIISRLLGVQEGTILTILGNRMDMTCLKDALP